MPTELTVTTAGDSFLHEADEWLDATIIDITADEGMYGPQLKWILHVDGDDTDRETWAYCSQNLSSKSKLYSWLNAGFYNLEVGATIIIEDLIGDRCQVMFERYEGTDPQGNALEKEKVVKIRAPKSGREKKAITKPAVQDVPADQAPF